ncbi:LysR family transcriptional regulator [Devosia ginsengisoli]|uniref:LysR family transcriptional regulator n=1 Tax=Devosia ginsengisoli TaxID=400770 RepID=A0A5B8LRS0_9HYPH|nr:LysR family transcriptional regulator [Devosia ginsengisoli]
MCRRPALSTGSQEENVLELRQLRYFLTVAREGTYGRAANVLHVAQPALSRQIKKLEEELGVDLFVRHAHGVSLTPVAYTLQAKAEHILDEVIAVTRMATGGLEPMTGSMKIGVSPGTAEILAYPLSRLAARRYPQLRCEFVSMLMPARADLLRDGKMDVAVMNLPRSVQGLRILPLMREPLCLIHRSDDERFQGVESLRLEDLRGVPLVVGGAQSSGIRSTIEDSFAAAGIPLVVAAEANTAGACKALVKENVGPTVHVAAMARSELERKELSAIPIQGLHSTRVIAVSAEREIGQDLRQMMDLIRECCSELVDNLQWLGGNMAR